MAFGSEGLITYGALFCAATSGVHGGHVGGGHLLHRGALLGHQLDIVLDERLLHAWAKLRYR
jgi:hypothetical protein